jgi:hypothetical protein
MKREYPNLFGLSMTESGWLLAVITNLLVRSEIFHSRADSCINLKPSVSCQIGIETKNPVLFRLGAENSSVNKASISYHRRLLNIDYINLAMGCLSTEVIPSSAYDISTLPIRLRKDARLCSQKEGAKDSTINNRECRF